MKLRILNALAVLGWLATAAFADDISACKSSDHYTALDKDYNACAAALQNSNIDDKTKAELLFARGETLYYGDRFDLALDDLNAAIALKPNYRDALYRRARTYYQLNRVGESMSELNSLIEANANDAQAIYAIGFIYEDAWLKGNTLSHAESAIRYYEQALKADPDLTLARIHLGIMQTNQSATLRAAIANFEKVLALKPEEVAKIRISPRPDGIRNLKLYDQVFMEYLKAKVSASQELTPRLLDQLQNIIEQYPSASEPLAVRSAYYLSKQKYEEALRDAKASYEFDRLDGQVIMNLLACYEALHRWQDGIDFANKVFQGGYGNFKPGFVLYKKAWFEEKLNKREDSLADYEASFQMSNFWLPSTINRLVEKQYYSGQLSDTYNEKMRDGMKACIIDPEC